MTLSVNQSHTNQKIALKCSVTDATLILKKTMQHQILHICTSVMLIWQSTRASVINNNKV